MKRSQGSSDKSNTQKGDTLEDYVAYLYEGFGYIVQRDVLLNGQQVDLLVTRQLPGAGLVQIVVECKYLSRGNVSNQAVHDFAAFVASVVSQQAITKGVMVTNASYTRNAKSAANKYVELLSMNELENELFALKQAYREAVAEYEEEAIFKEYITLSAKSYSGSRMPDVLSWLMTFLASKPPLPSVIVLADYGAGKTTLLRRLFHDAATAFTAGGMDMKPLYLELKYLNDQDDVDAFISSTLRRQMSIDIPMPLFWRELRRGGFLLLLDGFDEMSPQVDRSIRMSNFLRIGPLFRAGSPAVLTCRPSYFINDNEYKTTVAEVRKTNQQLGVQLEKSRSRRDDTTRNRINALYSALHEKYVENYLTGEAFTVQRYGTKGIETILLEPFSDQQIQEYLSRFDAQFLARCNRNSQEVKEFLLGIYDLTDLMQKPILLSMIKDTILLKGEDFFNRSGDYGPSTLYELYTNLNFDIDWAKGHSRRFLTRDERRGFAQALAVAMYENSKLEVSYADILLIVEKHQRIMGVLRTRFASVTQEQVAADVQVCTFITRTADEGFRFIHKSYMEFFVASFLNRRFLPQMLSARLLPKEIVYFLASFARLGEPIAGRIKFHLDRLDKVKDLSIKKESVMLRSNIYRVYLNSMDVVTSRSFRTASLDEIDLRKTTFERVLFTGSSFYRNRWESCGFHRSQFRDCVIDDCNLTDIVFLDVEMAADVRGCHNQRGRIESSDFNIRCNRFELEGTAVSKSRLSVRGSLYCHQTVFTKSEICISCDEDFSQSTIEFSGSEISQVAVLAKPYKRHVPQLTLHDCKLKTFVLFGPLLSLETLENVKSSAGNCSGFALLNVPLTHERSSGELAGELRALERDGYCWLSDTFVLLKLGHEKRGKSFIPEQAIQSILRLRISENKVRTYASYWQTWITQNSAAVPS